MPLIRLTALLGVSALVLAAAAPGALTPSGYRAQAQGICAKTKAQITALGNGKPMSRAQTVQFLSAWLAVTKGEYQAVRSLLPPATLAAAHRSVLWAMWNVLILDTKAVGQMQRGGDPTATLSNEWSSSAYMSEDTAGDWAHLGVVSCENANSFTLISSGK